MTAVTTSATPNEVKSATPPTPPSAPSALTSEQAQDVPIFLRKTYHMIDTCDPTVACWSDDGETFVVKDPVKFEKQIIPQFFKHSKFSSFVRQLNFYAFRKIKYADTIRIDPKLEAETANYWRFRHEKFLRGRPDLLGEIKRMNGQKQQQKKETVVPPKSDNVLEDEVTTLKKKIEAMSKNLDELTSMVQKVTLAQETIPRHQQQEEVINENNKRKKVEVPVPTLLPPVPDEAMSGIVTLSTPASMDLDDMPLPPSIPSPIREGHRETSTTSELSDEGFVDTLFTAFKTEDFEFDESESLPVVNEKPIDKRPRPELMNRLSDALALLPPDIQEMIIERLIQAITSPKEIQENINAAKKINEIRKGGGKALPSAVPLSPRGDEKEAEPKPMNLNLAAATLAALLQHFGDETKAPSAAHKSLLIPVHA